VTETSIIHRGHVPLIVLERHAVELDPALVARAREELLAGRPRSATGFRSGFLLGVQADARSHPHCQALADALRRRLLPGAEDFGLSFYKLAEGRPPEADDGVFSEAPHLDTHPELHGSRELLRLLVNLSRWPRRFVFAATDRWQLEREGIGVPRREFEPLDLPRATETRTVTLPGRSDGAVSALRFYASAVPHAGLNAPPEHFLVSFEAVRELRPPAAVRAG
jgi:hypothetical protein